MVFRRYGDFLNTDVLLYICAEYTDELPEQVYISLTFDGESLGFQFNAATKVLVIRKPGVSAMENWTIKID